MVASKFRLLLVDDDPLIAQTIRMVLPKGWSMEHALDLASIPKTSFHAAFVDLHLSRDMRLHEGLQVIETLVRDGISPEVIAISGDLNREIMEQCLSKGASRFLAKPLNPDEILSCLEKIESYLNLQAVQKRALLGPNAFVGSSASMQKMRRQIADLRGTQTSVLLEGETGTGKEALAKLLHHQEPDTRPFIAINMSAIPENLFESELFGHVKGAFTGAEHSKPGLLEAAQGGDLFFDEIEAFPISQQPKLLRFLETGEVRKVGSPTTNHILCRSIFATNENLNELVKAGRFREDLYWRIKGSTIQIPPLRSRKEDIPELAHFFLNRENPKNPKTLAEDALQSLKRYDWPGNIRELKRLCEQLSLVAPLPILRAIDVDLILSRSDPSKNNSEMRLDLGLEELLTRYEGEILKKALHEIKDHAEIQKVLKISRSGFYKKLSDHGFGNQKE